MLTVKTDAKESHRPITSNIKIPLFIFLILLLTDLLTKLIFENSYEQHKFHELFAGVMIGHEDHFKYIPIKYLFDAPIALFISILSFRKFLWISIGLSINAASIGNAITCNTRTFSTDWIAYINPNTGEWSIINLADVYLWISTPIILAAVIFYCLRFIINKLKKLQALRVL